MKFSVQYTNSVHHNLVHSKLMFEGRENRFLNIALALGSRVLARNLYEA